MDVCGCGAELNPEEQFCGNCGKVNLTANMPKKASWHFKAFVVITVVYLIYRSYQGIEWLIHHF